VPSKPIKDPTQRADAIRLKALFKDWQAERRATGLPFSQEVISESMFGFGQSALSQYLNGTIPLNADVLKKFAGVLGVPPAAISPSIVSQEQQRAAAWVGAPAAVPIAGQAHISPIATKVALRLDAIADHEQFRAAYMAVMDALDQLETAWSKPKSTLLLEPTVRPARDR
jgi:transcriptional regulator with XRE-family HTH domain